MTIKHGFFALFCALSWTASQAAEKIFSAQPSSGKVPLTVHFSILDQDAQRIKEGDYQVDFGDGQNVDLTQKKCTPTKCTASFEHTYAVAGSFAPEVSWTAACHAGPGGDCALIRIPISSITIQASGGPPTKGTLSAKVTSGYHPIEVEFEIRGIGGPFEIDFGDKEFPPSKLGYILDDKTPLSVSHRYSKSGTFSAKLISSGVRLSTVEIRSLLSPCEEATEKFLRGKVTPQQAQDACKSNR